MKGLFVLLGVLATLIGCATERGNTRQAQHSADQIKMIAVQREARRQEIEAESKANEKLFDSLARVCETNPDHCPAVTVALAVIGVQGVDDENGNTPVVQLQQQRDTGLEYVKALATPVSTVLTGVAIAGIQANVQKNASDNNRDILLGDQLTDAAIVRSVASLGEAAASSVGISAGGDIYQVSDNGVIDNSENTADSYNTTTSTETTETETYTSSFSLATTLNYDGAGITLADLITQLQNAGATYSIDLDGDGTPDVEGGDGEPTVVINCEEPQFSPAPPECSAT